uniref:Coiled-coil domain-containing protein 61 n=1 Tax=Hanusia phi TaxID=3032 RepID=A0A7S0HQ43_9CRYP
MPSSPEPAAPSEVCEDLTFHGTDYIVEVSANESNVLTVDVEKKDDGERWHGEFSASYIEEVTQKTGNFKKFSVFYKMLCSALKQASETVFADLLTYQDLEMLRSRQTRKPATSSTRPTNKRYLILTYAVEFDRVHYPLPLAHWDDPPPSVLYSTIRRLREEIQRLRTGASHHRDEGDATALRAENLELKKQKEQAVRDAERMRAELSKVTRQNDKLHGELEQLEGQARIDVDRESLSASLKEARRKITELENELANEREEAREEQAELRHQLVVLQREVDGGRQTVLDLKAKVRELHSELDLAKRRARIEGDPRLDVKRAIYGNNSGSRPSSAERRRPTPPPARPFQRFDPTAYVKNKQAQMTSNHRSRSVSPRPGSSRLAPAPASGASSRSSSRPSSAERERPWKATSSSRPSSAERQRKPNSVERLRPWADPPISRLPSKSVKPSSRPSSADRLRPSDENSAKRSWSDRKPSPSSSRAERDREMIARRNPEGIRARPPASKETDRRSAMEHNVRGKGMGGEGERGGWRAKHELRDKSDDENSWPRGNAYTSGEEISDIDARLNALQSFLQAAKDKAKQASHSRGIRS